MTDNGVSSAGNRSVKLSFLLTEDQAGPFPISVESLWCEIEGKNYRVKNIPFFVDEISFDDLISVKALADDLVQVDTIIEPSRNSTVWLYLKDEQNGRAALDALNKLGCGVEGGVIEGYFAVNVPGTVDINDVYSVVSRANDFGFLTADYPSIRHESD